MCDMRYLKYSIGAFTALLLVGCANNHSSSYKNVPERYTVRSGDTLSKIALRYNLNYQNIAKLNNIRAIDQIYVGQVLKLKPTTRSYQTKTNNYKKTNSKNNTQTKSHYSNRKVPIYNYPVNYSNQGAGSTQTKVIYPGKNNTTPVSVPNTQASQYPTTSMPTTPNMISSIQWVRPTVGEIVQNFGVNNSRGVYFSGNMGDPVYAAASGNVVYASDGVQGYGKLILIQHADGYVTAYAYNSRLLVKAGQQVNAGDKIAEMGNTGTERVWLQFQVRYQGKVINPNTVMSF